MSLFAPSEIEISLVVYFFAPPALSREQPQRAICRVTNIKARAKER